MIRALQGQGQGQTSQSCMDGPPFDDHHGDFSPTGRTGTHQHETDPQTTHEQAPTTETHTADIISDYPGHVMTERAEVPGGIKIALLEQVPPPVLPDGSAGTKTGLLVQELPGGSVPPVLPHDLAHGSFSQRTPPPVDPSAVRPLKRSRRNSFTHQRDTGRESDTRRDRSSLERSPSRGDTRYERSSSHHSLPHRDTRRHKLSSHCSPPHSNPQRPKKPRTRPASSVHAFKPYDLLDPDHVTAYQAYKRNTRGNFGVTWFQRFQTNFMDLKDTHIDAYLLILRKHQQAYPTVYAQRVNVLDSQFYSWLDIQWERMFGSGVAVPPKKWSMLKHKWHDDGLKMVRELVLSGNRPWHAVDWVMIPCNLGRNHWVLANVDLTQGKIYLLDLFRHEVKFHSNRTKDDVTYSLSKKAFRMSIMDGSCGVPQQHQGGNCGAHTLRLAEYLLANKKEFDWKEEDMGTIREQMAVEVYSATTSSSPHYLFLQNPNSNHPFKANNFSSFTNLFSSRRTPMSITCALTAATPIQTQIQNQEGDRVFNFAAGPATLPEKVL
ncbi:hypothetical protein LWI28_015135 [Acer negundo]|uniref:Ubiquitin-like protease family profile domain-containing protein n=1 Tax=Acer negundo TaxID=4023 RepID=A0AAD5P5U3_ACENE|nr:hypothetical protein LWI28_015135 [Acer negundo]